MRPREVIAGRFYMVTRRCAQRQFLLRPDRDTNNAYIYCLAEAAQRFGIEVLLTCAMSNHHHTVIFDRHGNYPAFLEHFHKMFAKCQNAIRGRWDNLWTANEQPSVVHLVDTEAVMDKLVYAATNPVKDGLVERVHLWPGVNGLGALLRRRPISAVRPRHYFSSEGTMPLTVTIHFALPPELSDAEAFLAELERRVEARENELLAARRLNGETVLGRKRVRQQSWRSVPADKERRLGINPRVASRNKWARIEALARNRAFVVAYRAARDSWLLGNPVPFPVGTYWLRRFANVPLVA